MALGVSELSAFARSLRGPTSKSGAGALYTGGHCGRRRGGAGSVELHWSCVRACLGIHDAVLSWRLPSGSWGRPLPASAALQPVRRRPPSTTALTPRMGSFPPAPSEGSACDPVHPQGRPVLAPVGGMAHISRLPPAPSRCASREGRGMKARMRGRSRLRAESGQGGSGGAAPSPRGVRSTAGAKGREGFGQLGQAGRGPWGCPGRLPEAGPWRSGDGTLRAHVPFASWSSQAHGHLALREDFTPSLEPGRAVLVWMRPCHPHPTPQVEDALSVLRVLVVGTKTRNEEIQRPGGRVAVSTRSPVTLKSLRGHSASRVLAAGARPEAAGGIPSGVARSFGAS